MPERKNKRSRLTSTYVYKYGVLLGFTQHVHGKYFILDCRKHQDEIVCHQLNVMFCNKVM